MTRSRRLGPVPVWPYFFLATVAAMLGAVFVVFWWPSDYPDESELTKISGDIKAVIVRSEISKTRAGAILPALTSVYFRLKGVDGEFRYPSTHPKYPLVRDYTAVAIDVWVARAELGNSAPVIIWQIQERNPGDDTSELTKVSYEAIVGRLTTVDRSIVELGYWLLAACGGFLMIGAGVKRWNQGRPHRLE